MTEPRPSVARFARSIVRAELARGGDAHDSDVAQRIMMRLYQKLAKLLGPAAFDVLVARSLVLARRAHPILAGVTAGSGGALAGLSAAAAGEHQEEDRAAAIVSHFFELLVALIGEDLAMRLVRDVWSVGAEAEEEEKK